MKSTVKHFQLPLWAGTEQNLPSTWAVIHTYTWQKPWLRSGLTGKGEGGTTWNKGRHADILLARILGGIWFWDVTIVHHPKKPRDKEDPKHSIWGHHLAVTNSTRVPCSTKSSKPKVSTSRNRSVVPLHWIATLTSQCKCLHCRVVFRKCSHHVFFIVFLLSCTEHLYTKSSQIYQEKNIENSCKRPQILASLLECGVLRV